MAEIDEITGRHADIPFVATARIPAAAAGSAADYEAAIFALTDLSLINPSSLKGILPGNDIAIKAVILTPEANITGVVAHNFAWAIRQWRAGSVLQQINTTSATTISSGSQAVTPANPAGIQVGSLLYISGGTGSAETVEVTAIGPGTFTATFANGHSGAYTIQSANLASVDYNATSVTETAYVSHQLTPLFSPILPGDVITLQRVSNDSTGLASPAVAVTLEYTNIQGKLFRG